MTLLHSKAAAPVLGATESVKVRVAQGAIVTLPLAALVAVQLLPPTVQLRLVLYGITQLAATQLELLGVADSVPLLQAYVAEPVDGEAESLKASVAPWATVAAAVVSEQV